MGFTLPQTGTEIGTAVEIPLRFPLPKPVEVTPFPWNDEIVEPKKLKLKSQSAHLVCPKEQLQNNKK